jgi:hypothetical protein
MEIETQKKESKTMANNAFVSRPPVDDLRFTFHRNPTFYQLRSTPKAAETNRDRRAEDEPTIEMTAAELQELLRKSEWPENRTASAGIGTRR